MEVRIKCPKCGEQPLFMDHTHIHSRSSAIWCPNNEMGEYVCRMMVTTEGSALDAVILWNRKVRHYNESLANLKEVA